MIDLAKVTFFYSARYFFQPFFAFINKAQIIQPIIQKEISMLQKFTFVLSLFLLITAFGLNAAAQTLNDETVSASDSKLVAINLPSGARRVKNANVPEEIKSTLAKIVASGGDKVRQGDSEVVIWGGNYAKSNGSQMISFPGSGAIGSRRYY
jgi:preprotein translocase subunit SecG